MSAREWTGGWKNARAEQHTSTKSNLPVAGLQSKRAIGGVVSDSVLRTLKPGGGYRRALVSGRRRMAWPICRFGRVDPMSSVAQLWDPCYFGLSQGGPPLCSTPERPSNGKVQYAVGRSQPISTSSVYVAKHRICASCINDGSPFFYKYLQWLSRSLR